MSGLERAVDVVSDCVIIMGSVLGAIITMDESIIEKLKTQGGGEE